MEGGTYSKASRQEAFKEKSGSQCDWSPRATGRATTDEVGGAKAGLAGGLGLEPVREVQGGDGGETC